MRYAALCFLLCSTLTAQEVVVSQTNATFATVPFAGDAVSFVTLDGLQFMPSDPLGMLKQKQIQEELELSKDQLAVVEELQKEIGRQTKEIFTAGVKFGGDAGQLMQTAQKTIREKITKELENILSTKQFTRLGQLEVQMKIRNRGVLALTDERIAESLVVSDEQKKDIRDSHRESQKELQEEIAKLRERHRKRLIKKLLSDEQLAQLEELSGDEYEVKAVNRRRFNFDQ